VGLANLVDGLSAIRRLVFEERTVSLAEVAAALREDFAGHESLRLRLLQGGPCYGNDDPTVDALARHITETITHKCAKHRTFLGDGFHPGFFCWVMHERLGAVTPATPDGRHAGVALGDGSGPAQGRERLGPTAAVLSATSWDHAPMLGGIAVNLRFTPPRDRQSFVDKLRAVAETFMRRGGFELQVNVVDSDTLHAARERPEAHRDLVVRIGGYSDYFVGLSDRMQDEIIARTEHGSA